MALKTLMMDLGMDKRFLAAAQSETFLNMAPNELKSNYELWGFSNLGQAVIGHEASVLALMHRYHMNKARSKHKLEPQKLINKSMRNVVMSLRRNPALPITHRHFELFERNPKQAWRVVVDISQTEELARFMGEFLYFGRVIDTEILRSEVKPVEITPAVMEVEEVQAAQAGADK